MYELETAVRIGVKITVVIFRDNAFGSIKRKELARFGRVTGVEFSNPDYVELARAFKVKGYRPEKASDLGPILREAVESKQCCLVDVPVNYMQ
jgi:acetolactate synthase-1/2/3 large subunit